MRTLLELIKVRIVLLTTASGVSGYLLHLQTIDREFLLLFAGLFLASAGACALNEYQDRDLDRRMARTRRRPLPSGRVRPILALWVATVGILSGLSLLTLATPTAGFLGLAAVVGYNGIYTPLKRVSPYATIPGAVVGALPPAMGWVASGGALTDEAIWVVMAFLYVWQLPHFWLLLLHRSGEYEEAGLPSIEQVFGPRRLSRIAFTWTAATAVCATLFPLFGLVQSPQFVALLTLASASLIAVGAGGVLRGTRLAATRSFVGINIFLLFTMALLAADAVVR